MDTAETTGPLEKFGHLTGQTTRYVFTFILAAPLILTWVIFGLLFQAGERLINKRIRRRDEPLRQPKWS
jgi:hypothetical protein